MPSPAWLPLLLGFLTAVGPVSTDMYLPAFPAIEAALGGHAGTAQATLAAWFAGLAVGQVTQGSLSDRFGRRWPLVAGTAIYTLGTAGCALAPDLATLSACRLVAAFGGSASMVIPRAIVRDLTDGHAAARMMSRLMLIMGAAPILAPSLGGLVLAFAGWQAIFWICAAYGAICCALVVAWLPDTLPPERRVRLNLAGLVSRYGAILYERSFITHALAGGFTTFGMFAYLGGSPAVFIDIYRLSPSAYGALFGACAAGFIAASQFNPFLVMRFGPGRVLRAAVRTMLLANIVLLGIAWARPADFLYVITPIFVTMACAGVILPNATVGALSRHAAHAGSASALMGTLMFVLGAVSGLLVGLASDGTARPMAALLAIGALAATLAELGRGGGGQGMR
ncbi:Bcr/CflA family efflux transporter [Rhodovastum atsumiense]|uniref:Bcr/CflA family efflux transporter n=1 Tax=Rhodovastum atsumiense TaxID=504468 RepID=A0A5M6IQ38_9PROT|nr:multidrug effflux MFS transporter [Rhodovastum atsumiense]KAA5610371.1 multidrug effflux MFS transporter [Rhodovastum atsumiense]CAH2600882.1 Bcr/CflA family efflux transporter [Rhodovastum atsumiense]